MLLQEIKNLNLTFDMILRTLKQQFFPIMTLQTGINLQKIQRLSATRNDIH